jgi:ribosomal protein L22
VIEKMKEVKAVHKYAKTSAFKARLVADQIRSKSVEEAISAFITACLVTLSWCTPRRNWMTTTTGFTFTTTMRVINWIHNNVLFTVLS